MNTLTKVIPTTEGKVLDIDLGNVCNYACSFCHPNLYAGNDWLNYNDLINLIKKFKAKHIILSGGEPTMYPQIDKLLLEISDKNIILVTNASNEVSWWEKNLKYINYPILGYHVEYADLQSFVDICEYISQHNSNVKVNISMIPYRFDECIEVANKLKEISKLTVVLKGLKNKSTQEFNYYTDEQLKILNCGNEETEDFFFSPYCEYSDKGPSKVTPQELLFNRNNIYSGWACWKGIDYLKVSSGGSIYRGLCDAPHDEFICFIDELLDFDNLKPVVCDRKACVNITDLRVIRKEKKG